MESLRFDVEPYGICTTSSSRASSAPSCSSRAPRRSGRSCPSTTTPTAPRQTIERLGGMNGQQGGDPAKLGRALVQLIALDEPPLRWIAGADAVAAVEQKAHELLAQIDAHRALSTTLAYDDGAS